MKKVSPEQPARTRVTKDPQERREELLDIAWELGRNQGFEALRVEQIVQTAGIAKGTFYHYFAAKDDVVEALVQRFGDGLFAELSQAAAQLGIAGWTRFRLIDWPALKRPLATAFAFAMALSLGDLGVIALFGSDQMQTLPYLLLARMGSYRTQDAAGLALILGLVCLLLVFLADRLGKERPA